MRPRPSHVLMLVVVLGATALARADSPAPVVQATRGLAAHVDVEYAPRLRAKSEHTSRVPMRARVSPVEEGRRQRVEFIGSVAGDFDLRDYLEREDGRPLNDLAPVMVTVVSMLPPNHGADLFASGSGELGWRAYYRELLWVGAGIWLAVPIGYVIVKRFRRRGVMETVVAASPAPTLEEQLRAALDDAARRALSVDERGRLELLMFRYLGERVGQVDPNDHASILRQVRSHAETRDVVHAIERWLHTREGESGQEAAAAALMELRRHRLQGSVAFGSASAAWGART